MSSTASPGNGLFPNGPTMRQPSISWLYRLECSTEDVEVGAPHNGDTIRSIANITRGTVKGPGIEGEILPLGGADWATVVKGTHVSNPSNPRFISFIMCALHYNARCGYTEYLANYMSNL
jgi:hypothetical protein